MSDTTQIAEELSSLKNLFDERLRTDESKEKAFESLYGELRQYKDDFLFQAEKPLLLDLLLFYDSLNWFQESLVKQEMSADVIADSFQYLIDEFLEVLYRRDVLPMESEEKFDRKNHKAVKVEEAESAEDDYKVTQVLKRGFTRADRLLRAEEVVIARFKKKK